jgi:hypothetical protein
MFAAVMALWRSRSGEGRARYEGDYFVLQGAARVAFGLTTCEPSIRHAQLMARRMERLQLDAEELADAEPLLFQELQAGCLLCECPERCAHALLDDTVDPGWQDWRDYCPNSTKLSMLSALQACCPDHAA